MSAFTTSCQLAGNVLALPEGYRAFTLDRDQTKDFSGLPVGAVCTVTETATGENGAVSVVTGPSKSVRVAPSIRRSTVTGAATAGAAASARIPAARPVERLSFML